MKSHNVTDEPHRGAIGDLRVFQHSGFEALRRLIAGELPGVPPSRLIGSRPTDVGLGTVSYSMPISRWLEDSHGLIEAGIFALFADAPLATALWTGLPPGRVSTTSEINMSFVRPAAKTTTHLIGRAETIHLGRQVGLSSIRITDQTGRLLTHGTTKCLITDVPVDPDADYPGPDTGPSDTPDPYQRDDPPPEMYWTADELAELAPIDLMRLAMRTDRRFPVWHLTGYEAVSVVPGSLTARIPSSPWFSNGGPAVYGGILAWLADHAMGGAVYSTLEVGDLFAPLDLNVRYTRPALIDSGDLTAVSQIRHSGNRLRVSSCDITNAEGKTVAMATSSALVVRGGARALTAGRTPEEIVGARE
jgi:uncharacterized protein (TIGR00369 family)